MASASAAPRNVDCSDPPSLPVYPSLVSYDDGFPADRYLKSSAASGSTAAAFS